MTTVLSLQGLSKAFEPGVPVLRDVDLQVEIGTVVCLLGPSGCGKTTLLRLIAGFEEPTAGELYLVKRLVSRPGMVVPLKNVISAWYFKTMPYFLI
jgi:ABC-type Fe3+/spermidine/putrescine transport system ATPase subunit